MKLQSEHSTFFQTSDSGSFVQIGSTSSLTSLESSPYSGIKARALSLKALFENCGVNIQKSPTLTQLIDNTIEMSDARSTGRKDKVTFEHLLCAAQIERISTAALSLVNCSNASNILESLLIGSINLLQRQRTKAKDTLWELELLRILIDHKIEARIDEPDLVVNFKSTRVGIACKKVYSEENFSKVLSNAIRQIEREVDFGIVALNIDDLLPENSLLKAPSLDLMCAVLTDRNEEFLLRHERYFRKYLTPGRAISALVSCAAIADVENAEHRFMNARQTTIWHIPGMSQEKEQQMSNFFKAMSAEYPLT